MILLTRLNNKCLTVNSDLIKFVEQSPDTIVTLINGEKIVVRETREEILALVVEFRRLVLKGLPTFWESSSSQSPPLPQDSGPESER